jgi:hypothetical protein
VRLTNVPVFDYRSGRTDLVTLIQGGNPDLAAERRHIRSLAVNIKPFTKRELRVSATYQAIGIRDQTGTVYAITPRVEALLPDLFVRDPAGRLVSVTYRPINFFRERQRMLNLTLSASGSLGKPSPPGRPGAATGPPPQPPSYYGGLGPSIRFSDRLQLVRGTPELDLLRGDTVTGGGNWRASAYAYGGINYLGNGMTFDAWYGGGNRVRSDNPASDLRFSPIFRLNMAGYISVHHFLSHEEWTRHLQLRIDVSNVTDSHQRVRDGTGRVPNRFQPDYLEPIGRTVKVTLRKLF